MPKPPPKEAEGPSKAWLDSYADAMTLLLAFFILLFAFSLVDKEKFNEFKHGVYQANGKQYPTFDGGVGILDQGNGVAEMVAAPSSYDGGVASEAIDGVKEFNEANAQDLLEALEERVAEVGAAEFVTLESDPRGVIVRMDTQVLFRSGSALILPEGVTVLSAAADIIGPIDNMIVVEGHTDSLIPNGETFPTNWELSTARATSVLRYLEELAGVPGPRLSAAGFAATRPRAFNNTEEGRAQNRRVELVVILEKDPTTEVVSQPDEVDPFTNPVGLGSAENPAQAPG